MNNLFWTAVPFVWLCFCGFWFISSFGQKSARVAEPLHTRMIRHWIPLLAAIALVAFPDETFAGTPLAIRLLPDTVTVFVVGLLLMVMGLMLAIWARQILGGNWSANVQIKHGHELITGGPYFYVRHPIYTALILMFLGNAIVVGELRGVFAVLIVYASFYFKYRKEEQMMMHEFGDNYLEYMSKTGALFPRHLR